MMRVEIEDFFIQQKQPVHLILKYRPRYVDTKQVEEAIEIVYEREMAGEVINPVERVWKIWEVAKLQPPKKPMMWFDFMANWPW